MKLATKLRALLGGNAPVDRATLKELEQVFSSLEEIESEDPEAPHADSCELIEDESIHFREVFWQL